MEDLVKDKNLSGTTQKQKRCYKCLLREMDVDQYFANLHEYIARIEEDIKAPDALYEERLSVCKECDYLQEGMCRACGCFVELRAAIMTNVCSYGKW